MKWVGISKQGCRRTGKRKGKRSGKEARNFRRERGRSSSGRTLERRELGERDAVLSRRQNFSGDTVIKRRENEEKARARFKRKDKRGCDYRQTVEKSKVCKPNQAVGQLLLRGLKQTKGC